MWFNFFESFKKPDSKNILALALIGEQTISRECAFASVLGTDNFPRRKSVQ